MAEQIVYDNWNDNICIAESTGPSGYWRASPCLEALTCRPRWRHLHHLERSVLHHPHPQTLLAPAHAPWVLPLLRLDQDWKKRHHHQHQRKRHQSPYHDARRASDGTRQSLCGSSTSWTYRRQSLEAFRGLQCTDRHRRRRPLCLMPWRMAPREDILPNRPIRGLEKTLMSGKAGAFGVEGIAGYTRSISSLTNWGSSLVNWRVPRLCHSSKSCSATRKNSLSNLLSVAAAKRGFPG